MKTYRFESYDEEDFTRVTLEFSTENDAWAGFDGPMHKFEEFLRGCGFCFHLNSTIGMMNEKGEFEEAAI